MVRHIFRKIIELLAGSTSIALKWLSRGTGIGYQPLPPLADEEIRKQASASARRMERTARRVERVLRESRESQEMKRLESALRRR